MTLGHKQRRFAKMFAKLILWANANGYEVAIGEVSRTVEQQRLYVEQGKSQIMASKHVKRLAGDLLLFKDGKYLADTAAYTPLGEFWEGMGGVWGGRWEGFRDGGHFEYKE